MELNELDVAFFKQLLEGRQIRRDMAKNDIKDGSAFNAWWEETGQHLPPYNLRDMGKDAWDAAAEFILGKQP